tara:strand:- start:221 stop:565 length:345 start_codon:yes stop_codon:yes gene_type:complete
MGKMAYIDHLCEEEDKKSLLEELGDDNLVNYYVDQHNLNKEKTMIKKVTGNLTNTEIVNAYISSYNRGRLTYNGPAYNRLIYLIEKFWSSKGIRKNMINKINHTKAIEKFKGEL